MKILFKSNLIRDYINNRRKIFNDATNLIGMLEVIIKDGKGLRNDKHSTYIKSIIRKCKNISFKTKSQKEIYRDLEDLYNSAIELYNKNYVKFLSKV